MKKILLTIFLALIPILAFAEWREMQSVEIPYDTPIYYEATDSGKIRCYFIIAGMQVPVTENNAYKFKRGEVHLELVKWYDDKTCKFKYTTRRKSNKNIDLQTLFK